MARTIDLNADLGEGVGDDNAMLTVVTSANVACGFHAGSPTILAQTCRAAQERGVAIGAQVSYPDREGFGRRYMAMNPEDLRSDVVYQIGALTALASTTGARVTYVKPHGALYNTVVGDEEQAAAIVQAVRSVNPELAIMGLPGAVILDLAREAGLPVISEAFADRGYRPDGTLVPRTEPGALLTDSAEIAKRVVELVTTGTITAVDGSAIIVDAESICLHGDTPGAVEHARSTRDALVAAGIDLAPVVRPDDAGGRTRPAPHPLRPRR